MKIICTVREFGEAVRRCEHADCDSCVLKGSCDKGGIECLVSAGNIVPDGAEDNEDV